MFDKIKKKFSEMFSNDEGNEKIDENSTENEGIKNSENIYHENKGAPKIREGNERNIRVIKRDEIEDSIEQILLESDVTFDATETIVTSLKNNLGKIKRKMDYDIIEEQLKMVIKNLINKNNDNSIDILNVDKKPYIILFLGINGTGKTTTIAKMAYLLKNNSKKVVISASDTFRAGAIEQLSILGDNIGVEVIKHDFKSDPASVAYDSIDNAKARHMDYVLIDSAGRMNTNKNLLDEMKKIKRVAKPDLTLLVLDAMIGQDVIEQANTFSKEINYDGVILTKLDTDAKGGAIISISTEIKKPILFIGTGQNMEDLMKFDVSWYLNKIFSS